MFEEAIDPPVSDDALTDDARRVLGFADAEARLLNHHYLGTEHLLLGLSREASSHAAQVLAAEAGLESLRTQIEKVVGRGADAPATALPLTPRARRALRFAVAKAHEYGQERLGADHVLLGVPSEHRGIAAQVLLRLDVDLARLGDEAARPWQDQDRGDNGNARS